MESSKVRDVYMVVEEDIKSCSHFSSIVKQPPNSAKTKGIMATETCAEFGMCVEQQN